MGPLRTAALRCSAHYRGLCGSSSVDPKEVEKFASQAAKWWHPSGAAAPLHRMNPARVAYIRAAIERTIPIANSNMLSTDHAHPTKPLDGVKLVDVGCGGGLVTEPLARLGATVLGIDKSREGIAVARHHAEQDPEFLGSNRLMYEEAAVEDLVASTQNFDCVLALEIVEHVNEPASFITNCSALVRPGGLLVLSTLNRTVASYALGIVVAERILGWLPPGTHDWKRFPTPEEVSDVIERRTALVTDDVVGIAFNPLFGNFSIVKDTSVNYMLTAVRPNSVDGNGPAPTKNGNEKSESLSSEKD